MTELNDVFTKVIKYGKSVREKHMDGLKAWNDIKPLFVKQINCVDWSISRKIGENNVTDIQLIYDYVHNELEMKGDENDDTSDHELWEKKHFFLQLIRIIKNNPEFSFVRLAQIAYNIGQLSVYIDNFDERSKEYFYSNELDKITSYINLSTCEIMQEELEQLSQQLDEKIILLESIEGGSDKYYAKYIKYKNKYLELKKTVKHKE